MLYLPNWRGIFKFQTYSKKKTTSWKYYPQLTIHETLRPHCNSLQLNLFHHKNMYALYNPAIKINDKNQISSNKVEIFWWSRFKWVTSNFVPAGILQVATKC